MRTPLFLTALAMLAACSTPSASRGENIVLIDPEQGAALLAQCSCPSPIADGAFFTPTFAEITALETRLAAVLSEERDNYVEDDAPSGAFDWPLAPSSYVRQYVGYEAGGRRMIYGNFLPGNSASGSNGPVTVCDGGPQFFGAEYDVAARDVARIAFNGGLGGPFYDPILRPAD